MTNIGQQEEWQIIMVQLEQAYEAIREVYRTGLQWIALALAGELALAGAAFQTKSRILLILGAGLVLTVAYAAHKAGKTLGALMAVALAREYELGIPLARSFTAGYLSSLRGTKLVNTLKEWQTKTKDDEVLQWLSTQSSRYAIFSFRNSTLTLAAIMLSILQLVAAVVLVGWTW